jgi:ferredoxin
MRISIDDTRCSGHGRCYDVAADLFDAGDDGRGVVRITDVPAHLEGAARLAVGSCPEGAIGIDP